MAVKYMITNVLTEEHINNFKNSSDWVKYARSISKYTNARLYTTTYFVAVENGTTIGVIKCLCDNKYLIYLDDVLLLQDKSVSIVKNLVSFVKKYHTKKYYYVLMPNIKGKKVSKMVTFKKEDKLKAFIERNYHDTQIVIY